MADLYGCVSILPIFIVLILLFLTIQIPLNKRLEQYDPTCSKYTDCATCTVQPSCGYSQIQNSCLTGTNAGSTDNSSSGSDWIWDNNNCPSGTDCSSFNNDCNNCTLQSSCGYCKSNNTCMNGDNNGSSDSTCSGSDWTWDSSDCSNLRAKILQTIPTMIPQNYGTETWNEIMGGKIRPGVFKYYSDGWGTTCGVVVGAVLEKAGAPHELINRDPSYKIGAHISKLYQGAKTLGLLRTDIDGLQPGDVYAICRSNASKGVDCTHVGFILERNENLLITADGGQSCYYPKLGKKQCAKIIHRKIKGDYIITPDGNQSKFVWRITWD